MRPTLPPKALKVLPVSVRLVLAKITVWRLRNGNALQPAMLTLLAMFMSATIGFYTAMQRIEAAPGMDIGAPRMGAALITENDHPYRDRFPAEADWGILMAELSRLRVLLKRLADLSGINGGEFDLDAQIKEPLSELHNDHTRESEGVLAKTRWTLVKSDLHHIHEKARKLHYLIESRTRDSMQILSGMPVSNARVSSGYGWRRDPHSGAQRLHQGIDLAAKHGTRVTALANGVVTYSGRNGNYGNLVELEHAGGYRSRYAHNSANLVSVGSLVAKGDSIALMGSTGKSTGTHVHVEIRKNGLAVDPSAYLW